MFYIDYNESIKFLSNSDLDRLQQVENNRLYTAT